MFRRLPQTQRALREELYWTAEGRFPARRMVDKHLGQARQNALGHLERQVADPQLRAALTPDYTIGCKRILISNDYYPALTRENVTLETTAIDQVTPQGIITRAGVEHELDVLVLCTGFEASDLPISYRITGRDDVVLADRWVGGEQAFACSTVNGFPNLFVMNGPNTGLGAGSILFVVERQIEYILGALRHLDDNGLRALDVSRDAEDEYVAGVHERAAGTVWLDGGCSSWYVDQRNGRLTTIWPDFMFRYRDENGVFRPEAYIFNGDAEGEAVSVSSGP